MSNAFKIVEMEELLFDLENLDAKILQLRDTLAAYKKQKKEVAKKLAEILCPFKFGDLVEERGKYYRVLGVYFDRYGILVEDSFFPAVVLECRRCRKDGKPGRWKGDGITRLQWLIPPARNHINKAGE